MNQRYLRHTQREPHSFFLGVVECGIEERDVFDNVGIRFAGRGETEKDALQGGIGVLWRFEEFG